MTELANTIKKNNALTLLHLSCYLALIPTVYSLLLFGHRFIILRIFEVVALNLLFKISKNLMIIP